MPIAGDRQAGATESSEVGGAEKQAWRELAIATIRDLENVTETAELALRRARARLDELELGWED